MNTVLPVLLVIFLIHLIVFSILGLKRRERYYLALVLTFSLLSASVLVRLLAPAAQWGELLIADGVRYGAWAAATVSVSWTILRVVQRRRARISGP
ncbi:MAG: hypothetical protein AAGJ52_02100 [Pseudomonadota bacterium]